MISVMVERIGSPVPLVRICGTSNNCKPPIKEVIEDRPQEGKGNPVEYLGRCGPIYFGRFKKIFVNSHHAGHQEDRGIPEPHQAVHESNKALALPVLERNLYGASINPICMSSELIGPPSENSVKNNIAKADAMIRLGR